MWEKLKNCSEQQVVKAGKKLEKHWAKLWTFFLLDCTLKLGTVPRNRGGLVTLFYCCLWLFLQWLWHAPFLAWVVTGRRSEGKITWMVIWSWSFKQKPSGNNISFNTSIDLGFGWFSLWRRMCGPLNCVCTHLSLLDVIVHCGERCCAMHVLPLLTRYQQRKIN